ncbi:type IV toxin-antitoxin system AbiEi family antitoxin domain-containing protein [Lachnospiraceae bacterium MD1]|uniref:Type IV toxin-antitoxin system AbiEi family antitoxin domain-containing protein n=2 Tax=Variimorphobacter saccharofermentans TaxID=2755051 RepID=A0A839JWG9_9FIRM|nr:type IV toxin-antitoxin system AbiEi family antitoxin domain-containing protein [Variimorphobacter saccharofermentans]
MKIMKTIEALLKENNGMIRTKDAVNAGLSRTTLSQLVKKGMLERVAQGQYIRPYEMPDELYLLQQRSDKIIFSHETALFLHGMVEQMPLRYSLTIPSSGKVSTSLSDRCKMYYVKPELYHLGRCIVMTKMGNEVTTYDAERTVCDILRSRSRMDSQIFVAAMKKYAARKNQDWNKLQNYSEAFHIKKQLMKYLEVLT